ncbi:hypothetical protein C8J57DRAFT_1516197 [Mycena rebaudengoi]|nr:hypothetical protein C8J57DRAFT_1516197 [Mycena rebaudengoi]
MPMLPTRGLGGAERIFYSKFRLHTSPATSLRAHGTGLRILFAIYASRELSGLQARAARILPLSLHPTPRFSDTFADLVRGLAHVQPRFLAVSAARSAAPNLSTSRFGLPANGASVPTPRAAQRRLLDLQLSILCSRHLLRLPPRRQFSTTSTVFARACARSPQYEGLLISRQSQAFFHIVSVFILRVSRQGVAASASLAP